MYYASLLLFISIHALREEGDFIRYSAHASWYPFLSTPSARRATAVYAFFFFVCVISIHALREEGDAAALA